jgi:hypothetical protein
VTIAFSRTTARDASAVTAFLARAFDAPPHAPWLDPAHLEWKYWSARPDWEGSRSFAIRDRDRLVAHAAAWPMRVRGPGVCVPAVHLFDWAADPAYPGAGVQLLRQIAALVPSMIAVGGSPVTRHILPHVGFERCGDVSAFARPVRPFNQARTSGGTTWRRLGRLARNTWWRMWPPLSAARGWSAEEVAPDAMPIDLWPAPSRETAVIARDAGVYRHLLACPAARHVLLTLRKAGRPVGYCCIAFAPPIARIADLWIAGDSADDWRNAFQTAAVVAAAPANVNEVSSWTSTRIGRQALVRAGFRLREQYAVSAFGDVAPFERRTLHVQMVDSDASFLPAGAEAYLT